MSLAYTYWQEPDGMWLGYMNDYPDYMTQGHTIAELQEMLRDIVSVVKDGTLLAKSIIRKLSAPEEV